MSYRTSYLRTAMGLLVVLVASAVSAADQPRVLTLNYIQHIVVIYAENRSFDNLYGNFPGAEGLAALKPVQYQQRDHDGQLLAMLPPVWQSDTTPSAVAQADLHYPQQLPNRPFAIDDPHGAKLGLEVVTRDLVHRFYQHKEQINEGKLDGYAAVSDAGGLSMGYYDGARLEMWKLAQEYTLADHFFMGAYGGSFLNHFWLICACTPQFQDAPPQLRARIDKAGRLLRSADSPARASDGPPRYLADQAVTPDGYAVNTVQPLFQPSGLASADDDKTRAPLDQHPLPAQTATTLGDTLSARDVTWAWYAGSWRAAEQDARRALKDRQVIYHGGPDGPNFQPHHQPFNYFANFAPGSAARIAHLKDAEEFFEAIDYGALEEVSFYKPTGQLNQHPGYTDVLSGDHHIAEVVRRIQASSLWPSTLIIITYDENGGWWDHVPPPSGDRFGPGARIPAIIISPFARKHFVDSTVYDTTSIAKLITRRYRLTPLAGVRPAVGDLTAALDFDLTPERQQVHKKGKKREPAAHGQKGKPKHESLTKHSKSDLQVFDSQ